MHKTIACCTLFFLAEHALLDTADVELEACNSAYSKGFQQTSVCMLPTSYKSQAEAWQKRTCQPSAVSLPERHADSAAGLAAEALRGWLTVGMIELSPPEAATQ